MLQDLHHQKALFCFEDLGQLVFLHLEHRVLELLRKLSALEHADISALFLGAAVGKPFCYFAEIFAVFHTLKGRLRLFLQIRKFRFLLSIRTHDNFPQRHLFRTYEFCLMLLVIFPSVTLSDRNVRPNFLADHLLGQNPVSNTVLEIFPVQSLAADRLFQIVHAAQLVGNANLVELLHYIRLDADSHVFAALRKQRLIN